MLRATPWVLSLCCISIAESVQITIIRSMNLVSLCAKVESNLRLLSDRYLVLFSLDCSHPTCRIGDGSTRTKRRLRYPRLSFKALLNHAWCHCTDNLTSPMHTHMSVQLPCSTRAPVVLLAALAGWSTVRMRESSKFCRQKFVLCTLLLTAI